MDEMKLYKEQQIVFYRTIEALIYFVSLRLYFFTVVQKFIRRLAYIQNTLSPLSYLFPDEYNLVTTEQRVNHCFVVVEPYLIFYQY